ncbi:MAG: polymer-forming cytoskeletal protein [candidate division Zixibacteria bacterium]|nr:polymer-forming cytoskeletal protein [candidate division Zixibacteria bacterium]
MNSRRLINSYVFTIALVFCGFFLAGIVSGSVFESGDHINISNLHHIDEDIYAFGDKITVDGLIGGDLLGFASSVIINGEISGSANVFAQELHHTGRIDGTLRAFGYEIEINGNIGRSLIAGGRFIEVSPGAVITRDANIWGQSIEMSGTVRGDVSNIKGDTVIIDGTFEGNLIVEAEHIQINPSAVISGNLTYKALDSTDIEISEGATIGGKTAWVSGSETKDGEEGKDDDGSTTAWVLAISKLLAAFLFGIIVIAVFRRYAVESFCQLRDRFSMSLATGFLALLVFAFSLVILIISLLLMIVGLILSSGDGAAIGATALVFSILMLPITSFTAISGGIIFYAGKIVVAFLVGYLILRAFRTSPKELGRWQLLVGLVILMAMFEVPIVGFLIYLLVAIAGAGAIVLGVRKCHQGHKEPPATNQQTNKSTLP